MKHSFQLSKVAAALAVASGMSLFATSAVAATPLAGTNISNVATATYTDNTGTERVVTSNEVKTLVAQIGSFTLEADREAETTANGQITFSHILTNTGNGTDKFSINLEDIDEAGTTTFDFSDDKFAIYIDRNKDGIADNQIALKPGNYIELSSGESIGLVVVATTPSTALEGQLDKLKVTVTAQESTLYTEVAKSNIDTAKITTGAVLQITKSANVSATKAGGIIEYTLTFKNTGNAVATNVAIFDVLPKTVEFVAGSARFNGSTVALTDTNDTTDKFEFDASKGAFLFNIDSVAANTSGKLTFQVKVLESTNAGNIKNIAYVDPDGKKNTTGPNTPLVMDDVPTDPSNVDSTNPTVPSNPSIVVVDGTYDGSINDDETDTFKDTGIITTSDAKDSIVLSGKQGVPVVFGTSASEPIVVHNMGNVVDTYNLTINKSAIDVLINGVATTLAQLPANSIIEILKADGNTPVTDTNNDGIVDTGPIAANSNAKFVVRVTLPNGEVIDVNGVGLTLESTSIKTKQKDTLKLIISALTANTVDLVNRPIFNDPTSDKGTGQGEGKSVADAITSPGTSTGFDITIKNEGNISDNYIITVPDVPNGWIVEVYEKNANTGECTTVKTPNSGNIKAGESKSFCMVVTPPTGTPADTSKDITVKINSPATGTTDNITFNVTVKEQRQLSFTSDSLGQIAPGGTIVYSHTLTNIGNVLEGTTDKYPIEIDWTSTLQGSNSSVYVDINNDGKLDANELIKGSTAAERNQSLANLLAQTGTAGLSPNEKVTIFVKVEAPITSTEGESDVTTVTFKPTGDNKPSNVLITDRTIINLGQVRLEKSQAVSTDCSTVPSTFVTTDLKAQPGTCVYYRITATNVGSANAENVVLSDMVPSYTVLQSGSIKPTTATESNGKVSYAAGILTPATSVTLEFAVKVDNQ